MLIFDFSTNVRAVEAKLDDTKKRQIPFAAAQALTELAREISAAEAENLKERLDRPADFTLKALKVLGARKDNLVARVVMMDRTAWYLEPYEEGGVNALNPTSKAVLKPVESKKDLNQFGNLPRSYTHVLKGMVSKGGKQTGGTKRSDVFVGPVKTKNGVVNGIWQRSTEPGQRVKTVRVNRKTGKVSVVRTAKGAQSTGRLKLLVKFTDPHPIAQKNRLDWFGVAGDTISKRYDKIFGAKLGKALRSAKP